MSRATKIAPSQHVAVEDLDLGYLAQFTGMAVAERVQKALAEAGHPSLRFSHGFVVQHLIGADRSVSELAERMKVTQQAASKVVGELESLGYVERAPGGDRRVRTVRLSTKGRAAVEATRKARARLEAALLKVLGKDRFTATREALIEVLETFGGLDAVRERRVAAPR